MRVASLLPSATEICYALDVEPVGVSHSCDYPPEAVDQPTLTRSRIDHDGASASEIDEQVRTIDGTTYALRTDRLAALEPDVILTQATCEVCAVEATAVHEAVAESGLDAEVVSLDPHTLREAIEDVRRVGRAVGRASRGDRVADELGERVAAATIDGADPGTNDRDTTVGHDNDAITASDDPSNGSTTRPRTLMFDWTDPVMLGGHWVPGVIERAGGRTTRPDGERTGPSRPVEWSWVRRYDPELLVVAPCGFELDRAVEAVEDLRARDGWRELTAVRENRVYVADGSGLFNRPGPRLVDSLESLRAVIDPDRSVSAATGVRRLPGLSPSAD